MYVPSAASGSGYTPGGFGAMVLEMRRKQLEYEEQMRQQALSATQQQTTRVSYNPGGSSKGPSTGPAPGSAEAERQKLLKELIDSMKADREEANAANQQRYDEAKGIFQQNIESLAGIGAQRQADISRDFQGLASRQQSDLVARGLGSTTIAPTVAMGTERERAGALTRAANETTMLQNQARQDLAGLIERREDVAPDYTAALIQLLSQG
jgi:hypothetical protein